MSELRSLAELEGAVRALLVWSEASRVPTAPPDRYKRGELLYVLDPQPLHNDTRLRICLVQVVSAVENTVTGYCRPKSPVDAVLAGQGSAHPTASPRTA